MIKMDSLAYQQLIQKNWTDGKNYKQEEAVPHVLDTNELLPRAETPVDAPRSWRGGFVDLKLQKLRDAHGHCEKNY